jgi:hypothetical protein
MRNCLAELATSEIVGIGGGRPDVGYETIGPSLLKAALRFGYARNIVVGQSTEIRSPSLAGIFCY